MYSPLWVCVFSYNPFLPNFFTLQVGEVKKIGQAQRELFSVLFFFPPPTCLCNLSVLCGVGGENQKVIFRCLTPFPPYCVPACSLVVPSSPIPKEGKKKKKRVTGML